MNVTYAIIEMATGRIFSSGFCLAESVPTVLRDLDPTVYAAIETVEPVAYNQHWYNAGVFEPLSVLPATWDKQTIVADGIDMATLSGLPIPCQVMLDNVVYDVPDGSFEFAADAPGQYYVWIDHPEFINKGWTIDAN